MAENTLQRMDLDKLETHLATLMTGYRDALRFVEGLPRLGRVHVEYPDAKQRTGERNRILKGLYSFTNPSRRWVARPLVRLFLEAHIRTKLEVIIRLLRIEASAEIRAPESNARANKLKSLVAPLDDLQKALFSWRQRGALFAKMPFLPVLIALATPYLARYTGINFSGAKAIAESTLERAQTGGLTRSIGLAAILLGELYMILAPSVTSLGFRIKRAILAGGTTEGRLYEEPEHITWVNFPEANIYHAENQVFTVIDIPKPAEFPLDFVMEFKPFYVFVGAVLYAAFTVSRIISGERLRPVDALGIGFWIVLAGAFVYGRKNFRKRRDRGDM